MSAGKAALDAVVADAELQLKLAGVIEEFAQEQEAALRAETLLIAEKTQVLEDEILAMQKLKVELQGKIATVEEIFAREQALSEEFTAKAASTKEAMRAASMYIDNLRNRLASATEAKLAVEQQRRMHRAETDNAVHELRMEISKLKQIVEEEVEERDELLGRWQAKVEIHRQSELESRLYLTRTENDRRH